MTHTCLCNDRRTVVPARLSLAPVLPSARAARVSYVPPGGWTGWTWVMMRRGVGRLDAWSLRTTHPSMRFLACTRIFRSRAAAHSPSPNSSNMKFSTVAVALSTLSGAQGFSPVAPNQGRSMAQRGVVNFESSTELNLFGSKRLFNSPAKVEGDITEKEVKGGSTTSLAGSSEKLDSHRSVSLCSLECVQPSSSCGIRPWPPVILASLPADTPSRLFSFLPSVTSRARTSPR